MIETLFRKIFALITSPLVFCISLGIMAWLTAFRRRRLSSILLLLSLCTLYASSMPILSATLVRSLENDFSAVPASESPEADAIVVLGGAVHEPGPFRPHIELTGASDRVLHAARLYRHRKAPLILAAGGVIKWLGSTQPEAQLMAALLVEWGVPEGSIVLEPASISTNENARETKKLLEERGLAKILLVTSAMHMPRALATFRATGIDAIPSPTDFQIGGHKAYAIFDFIPGAGALAGTTNALKEYLALAIYRWRGWAK